MKRQLLFLITLTILFLQCTQKETTTEQENTSAITLTAVQNNLLLMDKAGTEGNIIQQLPYGILLSYLNEISDFTTELTINNIAFNEPWLKVQLSDGETTGWVYAGGVKFDTKGEGSTLAKQVINKRLGNYFGAWSSREIETYQQRYEDAETALEFSEAFKIGLRLQDSLNVTLNQLDVSENQEIPDLFWIDEPLPALQPTNVDSGAIFHLFFDYKELMEKAEQTVGNEDDELVKLFYMIYSVDSIEYFYPSWHLKVSEFTTASLFGEGKHLDILGQLERINRESQFFSTIIYDIKIWLLNDILTETQYWQSKEKLLEELQSIINSDFEYLTKDDKIALQARLNMFEQPEQFQIFVNLREGEMSNE